MSPKASASSSGKRFLALVAAAGLAFALAPAHGADGLSVTATVPSGGAASKAGAKEEAAPKTDREIYYSLQEAIYKFPKSTDDRLRNIDRRAERLLLGGTSNASELKALRDYSHREIMMLAENYYQASREIPMKDAALAFRTRMMCEFYADAYRALGKGDIPTARNAMKRGKEKNDELLEAFSKDR